MESYVSGVKAAQGSAEQVFKVLSDMNNIQRIKSKIESKVQDLQTTIMLKLKEIGELRTPGKDLYLILYLTNLKEHIMLSKKALQYQLFHHQKWSMMTVPVKPR